MLTALRPCGATDRPLTKDTAAGEDQDERVRALRPRLTASLLEPSSGHQSLLPILC